MVVKSQLHGAVNDERLFNAVAESLKAKPAQQTSAVNTIINNNNDDDDDDDDDNDNVVIDLDLIESDENGNAFVATPTTAPTSHCNNISSSSSSSMPTITARLVILERGEADQYFEFQAKNLKDGAISNTPRAISTT